MMNLDLYKRPFWKVCASTVIMIGWAACATGPKVDNIDLTANPNEEIQKLEAEMADAKAKQVDVLSPENFKDARQALNEAKDDTKSGESGKEILQSVAQGRAYLQKAIDKAAVSRDAINEVVETRQEAIDAGAAEHYANDLGKVDDELKNLTEEIEDGDKKQVERRRGDLLKMYQDLELKSIQKVHLGPAASAIKQAREENGEKLAPRSLKEAEKAYADTEAYINANRHESAEVKKRSEQALASAQHALNITREAKGLKSGSAEQAALRLEEERKATEAAQKELSSTEQELAKQQDAAAGLAADVAFTERLQRAQQVFTPNEADVFQQGESILVRLKSLRFPTGKAVLSGANFNVLAKLQQVIKTFDGSHVRVEGHTDDRGSATLNEKLSQQRAQAVADYLASTGVLPSHSITAVGYGFQKPISPNKTEKGRAENRRVDVLITPQRSPSAANM